jgi:hypothetical protein
MPAESKAQQRLMGMALAAKRGKGEYSDKVKELADSMSEKQLMEYAKTKISDLPEKKAFILGFVKKAEEYSISKSNALELLKEAAPALRALQEVLGSSAGRALMEGVADPTRAALARGKVSGQDLMLRRRLADTAKKLRRKFNTDHTSF